MGTRIRCIQPSRSFSQGKSSQLQPCASWKTAGALIKAAAPDFAAGVNVHSGCVGMGEGVSVGDGVKVGVLVEVGVTVGVSVKVGEGVTVGVSEGVMVVVAV